MEDTSPFVQPMRVKRQVVIKEINDPPAPNTFDTTVDSMDIVIGGGRVRYHITVS